MKFGVFEIVLILLVIFIIFGAGKLPQLFDMFGRWKKDFKKNSAEDTEAELVKKPRTAKKQKAR